MSFEPARGLDVLVPPTPDSPTRCRTLPNIDRIVPLLVPEDIQATHDFLVNVLGFESGGVQKDGSGNIIHGEGRAGDAALWLHRVAPEHDLMTLQPQAPGHPGSSFL